MKFEIPDDVLEIGCELLDQMDKDAIRINNRKHTELAEQFNLTGANQFLKACVKYRMEKE